jgi:hypothetical protein
MRCRRSCILSRAGFGGDFVAGLFRIVLKDAFAAPRCASGARVPQIAFDLRFCTGLDIPC